MATKKKGLVGNWRGFYNYYLSDEEKLGIRKLLDGSKPPTMEKCLLELAKNNYKVSFTRNEANDTFVCSVTGKEGSLNTGYTYSLTHIDIRTAIVGLWFVVGEIHQWGEWPIEQGNVPNW